jgi:hypothetical protein
LDDTGEDNGEIRFLRGSHKKGPLPHVIPTVDLATDRFVPGAIKVSVTVYATFELE